VVQRTGEIVFRSYLSSLGLHLLNWHNYSWMVKLIHTGQLLVLGYLPWFGMFLVCCQSPVTQNFLLLLVTQGTIDNWLSRGLVKIPVSNIIWGPQVCILRCILLRICEIYLRYIFEVCIFWNSESEDGGWGGGGGIWFRVVVSWYVVCMMLFVPPASFLQASAVLHSKFTNIVASCIMCGLTLTSCVCLFFRSQL
jgi:hypothetical protein